MSVPSLLFGVQTGGLGKTSYGPCGATFIPGCACSAGIEDPISRSCKSVSPSLALTLPLPVSPSRPFPFPPLVPSPLPLSSFRPATLIPSFQPSMSSHTPPFPDLQGYINLPNRCNKPGMSTLWIAPHHPLVPDALKGTGRVLVLVWRLRPSFMKDVYERAREAEAPHWSEDLAHLGESCFD